MNESIFEYIDEEGVITLTPPTYIGKLRRRFPWQRLRVINLTPGPSMVQQSHHDATDINSIIARFARDGYFPPNNTQPQYADVTGLQGDLTTMYEAARETIEITDDFMNLEKAQPDTQVPQEAPPQTPPPETQS